MTPQAIALELLEYKLDDFYAGRDPKGGRERVASLLTFVQTLPLNEHEQHQLTKLHNAIHPFLNPPSPIPEMAPSPSHPEGEADAGVLTPPQLSLPPQSAAEAKEHQILQTLAQRVWWFQLERQLRQLAEAYRREPQRYSVRFSYSLLRNIDLYTQNPHFPHDTALEHFKVAEPVVGYNHPLLNSNDFDSVLSLLTRVVETVLLFKRNHPKASIETHQTLPYLKNIALALAGDPYCGKVSTLHDGVSTATQQAMFEQDIQHFFASVQSLFAFLADHLPSDVGGLGEAIALDTEVVEALNNSRKGPAPTQPVQQLTLRLTGVARFQLGDHELTFTQAGADWLVLTSQGQHPLGNVQRLSLGESAVMLFHEQGYVHAQLEPSPPQLSEVLSEALAVRLLMEEEHYQISHALFSDITGISAGLSIGATWQALQKLWNLCIKLPDPLNALKHYLMASAKLLDLRKGEVEPLIQALTNFMTARSWPLEKFIAHFQISPEHTQRLSFHKLPASLHFDGNVFKLRQYEYKAFDSTVQPCFALTSAEEPPQSFTHTTITALANGNFLCISRQEQRLAVIYLPN